MGTETARRRHGDGTSLCYCHWAAPCTLSGRGSDAHAPWQPVVAQAQRVVYADCGIVCGGGHAAACWQQRWRISFCQIGIVSVKCAVRTEDKFSKVLNGFLHASESDGLAKKASIAVE